MSTSLKSIAEKIHNEIDEKYIFGHSEQLYYLLIAYFSRGHVLLEGPPGTAKTLTAKLLSRLLGKSFKRIQFTTDMLPADILGANIYLPDQKKFEFIKGPIFSDFIVADEINRTPPRTQSALLEAMEERQVTIEGTRHYLSNEFFVIATQNPQDFEGTFPLPEVQMDRFLFKIVVDHAKPEIERQLIQKIIEGILPPLFDKMASIPTDRETLDAEIQNVKIDSSILDYITKILALTREHSMLSSGSSVRGGIALAKSSRILALLQGRDFVTPDDIKTLSKMTLRHRVKLSPEAQVSNISEDQVIEEIVASVEFPQ